MGKRRVVITGMGIVSPVGSSIEESWKNILAGKSGINTLTNLDTEGQSVTFGGSVKNFAIADYLKPKDVKKMDTFIHYGMAAGIQAFEECGIEVTEQNAARIGVAPVAYTQLTLPTPSRG
jgi:3-oxoacyl-[acyl-carrier-protein] synthase II